MAAPILTQEEIDQLEVEKARQERVISVYNTAIPAKEARVVELEIQDGAFRKFFDYYNDDIIGQYDAERRELDGLFVVSPIIEDDILKPACLIPHRTTPTLPATDIIRITEFDGGGTSTDAVNESQHIIDQALIENLLQNGQTGTTPTLTGTSVTDSALSAASTSLDMLDATGPMSFTIGDEFVVHDGGSDAALVRVTSVTDNAGGDPPYEFTLGILVVVPPSGTISSGADTLAPFDGFTDGERNTKTASDSDLQPIMDTLVASLQAILALRQARLAAEIVAIDANEDPDAVTELASAKTDAQTSDTFITNYLVSTDVSDSGLASLSSERGTRTTEIATRIAQILANYTGQTENFYDRRFGTGNDRGNTFRGTLRLKKNADESILTSETYADNDQD